MIRGNAASRPPAGMDRRQFGRLLTTLCALGSIEPHLLARALGPSPNRLSWRAFRNAEAEGAWRLNDTEGEVPRDLHGTLYRIAPGQSDNHGTPLNHLFDGDAFVSAYSFDEGRVSLRAQFLATAERQEELAAGRMLFREFGTNPPPLAVESGSEPPAVRGKNQPNVNIVSCDGRLLALSEGGHPTAVDPKTLEVQGSWDFHGTLPPYVPFTAHPKFDPETGEAYGYGVTQGPGMALNVFRIEPDGKLHKLHAIPQTGYFMIHDMMLTKRHLVFVIPPVQFDLMTLFRGDASPAQALRYLEQSPTRILILSRDGSGDPIQIEQPANMVFHNGNAYEQDGRLTVDTVLSEDGDVLRLLAAFANESLPIPDHPPRLTRIGIDLKTASVVSRTVLENDQEFPRFDPSLAGTNARYLLTVEGGLHEDPIASTRLVRHDLHAQTAQRVEAGPGRAFGEAVPVRTSNAHWILQLGYDSERDQTFLEVRDHDTLDLAARIWSGLHLPLGFHGNFVPDLLLDPPAA